MYKKIILILIIVLIPRIPFLWFAGPSYNDPFQDAARYYLLAKSIKDGKGLTVDYAENFFLWEGFNGKEEITRNYWVPIGYPLFLSLVLTVHESIFAAMVFQVVLTFFFAMLIYLFFRKIFDETIAMFSVIIMTLMPDFFVLSRIPFTEVLYMISILVSIYIVLKNSDKISYIIFAGIISSFAFYTRYTGVILICSVFFWLLINKKYLNSIYFALTSLICLLPFFYINYYYHNDIFAFLKMSDLFPPAAEGLINRLELTSKPKIVQIFSSLNLSITDLSDTGLLFILFPFALISLFKIKMSKYHSLIFLLIIFTALFHIIFLSWSEERFFLPLALLLVPMALDSLKDISGYLSKELSIKNVRIIFYLIPFVVLLIYILSIANELYDKRKVVSNDYKNYEWIKNNANREDNILVLHPYRCNYFTGNKTVNLPSNLNEEYFEKFIDIYDIKYIQTRKSIKKQLLNNEFYNRTIFSFEDTIKINNITIILKDYQSGNLSGDADEVYTYEIKNN